MCCRCPDPRMHPKTPGEHVGSTPATARLGVWCAARRIGVSHKGNGRDPRPRVAGVFVEIAVTGFASNVSRPSICDAGQPQIR